MRSCLPLLWLALCTVACVPTAAVRVTSPPPAIAAADFPGAPLLLAGFDRIVDDPEWSVDDAVLFGLQLRRGTVRRHWLLHLRVVEVAATAQQPGEGVPVGQRLPAMQWQLRVNDVPQQFPSRCARLAVTVATADGEVLGRSQPVVPRDLLARGFGAACRWVHERRALAPTDDAAFYAGPDLQPLADASVAAVALLQVVQRDAVLSPLLWEVIERPSLWSMVRHLGARLLLQPRFHAALSTSSPVAQLPISTWNVPMTLSVNDEPTLEFELAVTPARSPLCLAAGVLSAVARNPSDPAVEFRLLLLGARRGAHLSWAIGRDIALDSR